MPHGFGREASLLLLENDPANADIEHFNNIADRFGIHFNAVLSHHVVGTDYAAAEIPVKPDGDLFHSSHVLYMKDTCTLSVSAPARALVTDRNVIVIATAKYGKGTVLAVVDPWLYNEYTDGRKDHPSGDNFAAGKELVRWVIAQRGSHDEEKALNSRRAEVSKQTAGNFFEPPPEPWPRSHSCLRRRHLSAARICRASAALPPPSVSLDIKEFGAVGDGKTNDTLAIQQALDRCSVLGGGQVRVPAGDYLMGTIMLHSNTTLHLDPDASLLGSPNLADYPLTQVRWEGHWVKGYLGLISAIDANNIGITGTGKIVGNPAIKGRVDAQNGLRHPALLEFVNCNHLRVEDCVTQQNDMWSIHPVYCDNVLFRNVTVRGGADGIDVDSCSHVVIEGCTFSTGDDCISLKSGRGAEGYAIHRPTEDVRITNCTFADSHWACIGIGSETSGGIRNVHIDHCKCTSRADLCYLHQEPPRTRRLHRKHLRERSRCFRSRRRVSPLQHPEQRKAG